MFLIGNTVTYSSKQLLISAPQNYCAKSVGESPKKVCHASFLQFLVYIVLGQDDNLGKNETFHGTTEYEQSGKAW